MARRPRAEGPSSAPKRAATFVASAPHRPDLTPGRPDFVGSIWRGRFGERWAGTWASPSDPAREREIDLAVAVSLRPSRQRWPVCAEIDGVVTVEGWFAGDPIAGVAEIARVGAGLCLRYVLANDHTRIVVARRLDPRDRMSLLLATCADCIGAVRVLPKVEP